MNEILSQIYTQQIQAIDQHQSLSNLYGYFGLHGFKRLHDYRAGIEIMRNRRFGKWIIDHTGMLPRSTAALQEVIPVEFFGRKSSDMQTSEIQKITLSGFTYYETKLVEELDALSKAYGRLDADGHIDAAHMVGKEVDYVSHELKRCRRIMADMRNCEQKLAYIAQMQGCLHGKYKKKLAKLA